MSSKQMRVSEAEAKVKMSLSEYFGMASARKFSLKQMCKDLGASRPVVSGWLDKDDYEYEGRWIKRRAV